MPEPDDLNAADYIVDAAALVTCTTCGERHWYLTDTDGMSHMASLPGYTWGQEPSDGPEPELSARRPNPWPATPRMTRQHFNYLARALVDAWPNDGRTFTRKYVIGQLAGHLADCNPRFDRERFVEAASRR